MGKAATTAMVLLYTWCIFMFMAVVSHWPPSLSAEALRLHQKMFETWAVVALLALVFTGVDLVNRASLLRGRRRTLLVVDVFAVVLLTMMMVGCMQFAQVHRQHYWYRVDPWFVSHTVDGPFSYPSTLVPGSEANEEWREFQKWLQGYASRYPTIGVDFHPDHPVRFLSQCTPDLWQTGCEEVRIRIGDGPEHRLRPHDYLDWRDDVLLVDESGSLDTLRLVPEVFLNGLRDQVSPVVDVRELPRPKKVGAEELDRLIHESNHRFPLQILVPRDASLRWLDLLLRRFENRGVEYFDLVFHG